MNKYLEINYKYIIPPLISMALFMLGSSYFTSYISLKLSLIGTNKLEIGYIHSAFYAGMLLGSALLGMLVKYFGHLYSYILMACLAAISLLAQGFNYDLMLWISMRFIFGISLAGIYIVIESWILANSPIAMRGYVLAVYMIVLYSSQVISHEFLNIINLASRWPYVIASLFCIVSQLPLMISISKKPTAHHHNINNFSIISKISTFDLTGCLVSGLAISAMLSFIPIFANHQHYSVATLMQITIAGGCLLHLPIIRLSYYFNSKLLLFLTCIATSIVSLAIWIFYLNPLVVYFLSFFLGGFGFTLYTLSILNACNKINPIEMVNVNAVLLLTYCIGSVFGPIFASLVMDYISIRWLYAFLAIVTGILTLVGLSHQKRDICCH